MTTLQKLRLMKDKLHEIAAKYGATNLRVFGSVAREEDDENSDIDFLVSNIDFKNGLERVEMQFALEEMLNKKVDVVIETGLRGYSKALILQEAGSI